MSLSAYGDPVKGEIARASGPANVAAAFYNAGVTPIAARTLKVNEFLTITDVLLISDSGGAYALVFYPLSTGTIADGAGLRIVKGIADAKGGVVHHFETPVTGPPGCGVGLVAADGRVDVIITGGVSQV